MNKRLRELRKDIFKLSQKKFGEMIGLKQSTINDIESGKNSLKDNNLKLICQTFNVNEDWLRNGVEPIFKEDNKEDDLLQGLKDKYQLDDTYASIIKSLVSLDSATQNKIVDFMFNVIKENIDKVDDDKILKIAKEVPTINSIEEIDNIVSIEEERELIDLKLYYTSVSAGTGSFLNDYEDYEIIQVDLKQTPQARRADFALRVRGDSMEPYFYEGDIVYIREQPIVDNGQIGVFIYDNESYIKKYSVEDDGVYLVSLNEKYEPIKLEEDYSFRCCGLVL